MDAMSIQERLDEVRIRLLETISDLPDEALQQPGAVGDWSVADVLAHLVNWEAELVTALNRIDQGRKPSRLLQALEDRQVYNAARVDEVQGRDLDRIFDDLQGVRVQLEEWLESFTADDLEKPGRVRGAKKTPLWELIAAASFEHEAGHLPALEEFAERWRRQAENTVTINDIKVMQNGRNGS